MHLRAPLVCIALGLGATLWGGLLLLRRVYDTWEVAATETTVMLMQVDDRTPWAAILTLGGGFALVLIGLLLGRRSKRAEGPR